MWGRAGAARHPWLLVVVIAAGLVGMHHLVHEHAAHTMLVAEAEIVHVGHAAPDPAAATPLTATPLSISAMVSQASWRPTGGSCGHCDPMGVVGHLCLAVLTAVTALVAALIFAVAWLRRFDLMWLLGVVSGFVARAPPTGSVRLTQLCVLRR